MEKSTDKLAEALNHTARDQLEEYFKSNPTELITSAKPFAAYMRTMLKSKNLSQQDLFTRADISEGYGYKIIAEERHVRDRDIILRLCFGARFTLDETQRTLKLYGMCPLYPRIKRDAVLIVALNSHMNDIDDINEFLITKGERPLRYQE